MKKINIVGLGAGDINQLPLGVYKLLKSGLPVYLRTKEHPVVSQLEEEGFEYQSFDHIYESHAQFEAVYQEICETLFSTQEDELIYGVPGHPLVAEKTVQLLKLSVVKAFWMIFFVCCELIPLKAFNCWMQRI